MNDEHPEPDAPDPEDSSAETTPEALRGFDVNDLRSFGDTSPAMERLTGSLEAARAAMPKFDVPGFPRTPNLSLPEMPQLERGLRQADIVSAQLRKMDENRGLLDKQMIEMARTKQQEKAEALQREIDALDLTRALVQHQEALVTQQAALVAAQNQQLVLQQEAALEAAGERKRSVAILVVSILTMVIGIAAVVVAILAL